MAALLVLTYLWVTVASGPIGFLYGRTPGFSTARNITQLATIATAVILFMVAMMVAIPTALQPGNFLRKMLYVLPLFFLLVTLAGAIANLVGIGTVGALIGEGPSGINFATLWIAAGAVLSTIAVVIAAARANLSARTIKTALATMGLTGLASLFAAAAMVVTVVIVSTNQPTQPSFGPPGGEPGARAQGTRSAAVGTPAAAGTQAATSRNGGATGGTGGGEGRQQNQPGGGPGAGGPGGRLDTSAFVRQYTMGGALMAIFAVIELVSLVGGWRATRTIAVDAGAVSQPARAVNIGSELGRAIIALLAVAVVALVVIQLVPISRTNPSTQAAIAWDSPQTQQLWERTCADCHSNNTRWPWYASIAPSSWLTLTHVNAGRQQMNVSELDKMPAFRKANLANDMAQQIRSGNMPPSDYLILHPDARLSDAEKQQLIQGLQKTFAR